MQIKNKLESIQKIDELKLNRFEEELFHEGEDKRVIKFLNHYPYDYYAIRSRSIIDCELNQFKVLKNEVLNVSKNFDLFSINVSSYNFIEHLILIGDIRISKDGEVWLIASRNKNYTGRMAESNPDFNLKTNLFDKILDDIPGFDILFQYIVEHNLLGVIVECAVYDIPMGIYHEQVILFEIRTDY